MSEVVAPPCEDSDRFREWAAKAMTEDGPFDLELAMAYARAAFSAGYLDGFEEREDLG